MAGSPYRGAYGLNLPQFGMSDQLVESPASWPTWTLTRSDRRVAGPWEWAANRAVLPALPGGRAVIDRLSATTTLHSVPDDEEGLLHPHLGTTALAVGAWAGYLGLHGGVVSRHGRAWAFLGDRGAGKSSTLMWWLANAGTVLADDLLLTDGKIAFAGPRFIDLRAGAARRYSAGVDVGVLGTRRRWRVPTGEADPEVPLAGVFELAWGESTDIVDIPVSDRLDLLARHRGLRYPVGTDERSAMHLLAKPCARFTRVKAWESIDEALEQLVEFMDRVG